MGSRGALDGPGELAGVVVVLGGARIGSLVVGRVGPGPAGGGSGGAGAAAGVGGEPTRGGPGRVAQGRNGRARIEVSEVRLVVGVVGEVEGVS